jgi:hypothetical protein
MDFPSLITTLSERLLTPHPKPFVTFSLFWGSMALLAISCYGFCLIAVYKYLMFSYSEAQICLFMALSLLTLFLLLLFVRYLFYKFQSSKKLPSSLIESLLKEFKPYEKYGKAIYHFLTHEGMSPLQRKPLLIALLMVGAGFLSEKLIRHKKDETV